MFVGYEVKSNQTHKPILLPNDIKLSQAVLDPSTKGNKKEPVCLMAEYDKKQFIIAVLDPNQSWQCPLDLMFAAGTEVKFSLRGSGTVHLTGFEYLDDYDDMSISESSDEDFEDEEITSESDDEPAQTKAITAKASAKGSVKGSAKKSPKVNGVKPLKKNGKAPIAGDEPEEDDSDSEDLESFNSEDFDQEPDDDDDDDDDESLEEDDDDDEDDDQNDDDDDEEMDELGELDEEDSDE